MTNLKAIFFQELEFLEVKLYDKLEFQKCGKLLNFLPNSNI